MNTNSTSRLELNTFVTTGRGLATDARHDDLRQLERLLKTTFVNGSLNLLSKKPVWLDPGSAIYRNGSAIFWNASLNGLSVVIGRWLSGCPAHVFEVFATLKLRDALGLNDGDEVILEISKDIVSKAQSSLWAKFVWILFWKLRERQVYRDGRYLRLVSNRRIAGYSWKSMQRA